MSGLLVAVTFLTRIPLPSRATSPDSIARSLPWFPVVGAGIGAVTAGTYVLAGRVWPPLVAAVLATIVATLLTGAFHEDGLADTADAFGGSFDRERALEIFKDPRHGSYGVLALVLSGGLRVFAIAALAPSDSLVILPVAHALSRGFALQLLAFLKPAAPGLGASYASAVTRRTLAVTALVALCIAAVGASLWAGPLVLAALPGIALVGRLSARKIGGITGDVLGAAQQVAELSILLAAIALAPTGGWTWWS